MPERLPAIKPYEAGTLDVGDDQRIYGRVSGGHRTSPQSPLHCVPGSGGRPDDVGRSTRMLTGSFSSISVAGSGNSRSVADLSTSLDTNTTKHLISDI